MPTETKEKKEKVLRKFRLKAEAAPHYEPNPEFDPGEPESDENIRHHEILPGKIIESRRPLDKIFVNKFEVLTSGGDRSEVQSAGGDVVDPECDPDADRPVRSVEDARVRRADRFLTDEEIGDKPEHLKANKGKKVKRMVEEDAEDERETNVPTTKSDFQETDTSEEAGESGEEGESSEPSSERKDVTKEYEGAKEGGMKVFEDEDGTMFVHESGEDEPMVGSKRGFTTKKEVKAFIKKNVKE